MSWPEVLDPDERQQVALKFGVDDRQVERDHPISHLLAATSSEVGEDVLFFGGTALSRSVLPEGRLSEDIDLIALGSRRDVASRLTDRLPVALRREFPGLTWDRSLTEARDSEPAVLRSRSGLTVRIQLLGRVGYPAWPHEYVDLSQRYTDAGPARLNVLTPPAFAAAKAVAWYERRASRDLWDLWAMAEGGHLNAEAAALYARLGPTNRPPRPTDYGHPPDEALWERDLSAQVRLIVTAKEAAETVVEGWRRATS